MKIHGLQKMTLLDFPGRVACTVFLGGCDFRCPYCHNFQLADGSAKPLMEEGELLSFLEKEPLDVLVTLGAGDIDRFIEPITGLLKQRL